MTKKTKYLIFIFLVFFLMNGCKGLKDGLEGNKRSKSAEEFLIETKNPLILPPEFDTLPVPKSLVKSKKENINEFDIDKVIGKPYVKKNIKKKKINNSLEESIIEKIKSR
jgi:hypothetical protein